jgi:endonuclease-3
MSEDPIRERLEQAIPHPACELRHESAWQLLVATILSAQATDKRVNRVTPELFRRWPTPAALGAASQEDVEEVVRTTGFFRNKARAIREASHQLVERFDGEVPQTIAEAVTLRGVARKTANLVLGTAMGIAEGIVVDTHVSRVSMRLELTAEKSPVKVERDLCARYPSEIWVDIGHRLLLHGRYVCVARKPRCVGCPLNEVCPSAEASPEGSLEERLEKEREQVEDAIRASVG